MNPMKHYVSMVTNTNKLTKMAKKTKIGQLVKELGFDPGEINQLCLERKQQLEAQNKRILNNPVTVDKLYQFSELNSNYQPMAIETNKSF